MNFRISPLLILLALPAVASASVITFTDSVPLASPNFSTSLTVPGFDTNLGTLTSVEVTYNGFVQGDARAENLSESSGESINLQLAALLQFTAPNSSNAQVFPLVNNTFAASVFDGTQDFGGTSGVSFVGISGTDSDTVVLTTGLPSFFGPGNVSFTLNAFGSSMASGGGNIVSQFGTDASADISVSYIYTSPIPEPSQIIAVLSVAVLGLLAWRRLQMHRRS